MSVNDFKYVDSFTFNPLNLPALSLCMNDSCLSKLWNTTTASVCSQTDSISELTEASLKLYSRLTLANLGSIYLTDQFKATTGKNLLNKLPIVIPISSMSPIRLVSNSLPM